MKVNLKENITQNKTVLSGVQLNNQLKITSEGGDS